MIETDADEVYNQFLQFSTKEMRQTLKKAVRESASKLRKEARTQLRKSLNNTNKINPKYNDSLQQGVRLGKVHETKKGDIYAYVMITSNRKTGSGSFRLHILEKGSAGIRYAKTWNNKPLKKPRNTGVLKPANFFYNANMIFESQHKQIMETAMKKAVDKTNAKKFGK